MLERILCSDSYRRADEDVEFLGSVETRGVRLQSGRDAAPIGRIEHASDPRVILKTPLGGERFLEELEEDPLPRIC